MCMFSQVRRDPTLRDPTDTCNFRPLAPVVRGGVGGRHSAVMRGSCAALPSPIVKRNLGWRWGCRICYPRLPLQTFAKTDWSRIGVSLGGRGRVVGWLHTLIALVHKTQLSYNLGLICSVSPKGHPHFHKGRVDLNTSPASSLTGLMRATVAQGCFRLKSSMLGPTGCAAYIHTYIQTTHGRPSACLLRRATAGALAYMCCVFIHMII
jgi:hypothetical protein